MHPVRNGNHYHLGLVVRADPCATDERARDFGPATERQEAPARASLRAIDDAPPYAARSGADDDLWPGRAEPRIERRRLAILAADIVGYCRHVERDDIDTALRLRRLRRQLLFPAAQEHGGWVAESIGDCTLMAFSEPAQAVSCAIAIRRKLARLERDSPEDQRLELRMGVSVGGVIFVDGELFGQPVNVAARLAALAGVGEIYLTEPTLIDGQAPAACEALGERTLRNIATPVRVYRIADGDGAA